VFPVSQFVQRTTFCLITLFIAQHRSKAQGTASRGTADRVASEAVAPRVQRSYTLYAPLTQKERWHDYFRHMFSFESVLRSGAAAGINQALNTPREWGQGAAGYAGRFGSSYGGHIIRSTAMYGTSAVLHEDTRYFRSARSGLGPRLTYALASTFMARHDDGSRHVSFARLGSYTAGAFISRAWQPPSTNGPSHALNSIGITVGAEAGFNVAREFLPGIFHAHVPVDPRSNPAH